MADDLSLDWRGLGCKPTKRVGGVGCIEGSRAAWRLRAPRRSPEEWAIEVGHCPYLGKRPYDYGDDAWRISIQTPLGFGWDEDRLVERAHLVATSEAEAFEMVAWLDAVASGRPRVADRPGFDPRVFGRDDDPDAWPVRDVEMPRGWQE